MPAAITNAQKKKVLELREDGKTLPEIASEVGIAKSSVSRIVSSTSLDELGADEGEAEKPSTSLALVPAAPPPSRKTAELNERIAELEESNTSYQQRVLDLLEHVAELSMENVRLAKLARAAQEG